MEKEIAYIKAKLDMLCAAVLGDPTNPDKPGLILRIDRLEQKSKLQSKILWLLGGGVVTALIRIIVTFFK